MEGSFKEQWFFPMGRVGISQGVEGSFEGVELGDMSLGIQRSLGGV